jgi:hypothetical protein
MIILMPMGKVLFVLVFLSKEVKLFLAFGRPHVFLYGHNPVFKSRAIAKINPSMDLIMSPVYGIYEKGDVEVWNWVF